MGEELHALRTQLKDKLSAARNDDGSYNLDAEGVAAVNRLNDDITKASKAYDESKGIEDIRAENEREFRAGLASQGLATQPTTDTTETPKVRDLKTILSQSPGLKAAQARAGNWNAPTRIDVADLTGAEASQHFGMKTVVTLTEAPAEVRRTGALVPYATEERTVRDLMLQGSMDGTSFTYLEETTFTNGATTVAEDGTKPESALAFTERTATARKIATWLPVTDEALADNAFLDSYIRGRLRFMVERTEEVQLLTGNGTPPNLRGINNATGVQTQAKGADPTPDAVYKAITLIRNTGFAEPTAAVFHPNDWRDIRLLRTADGIYIFGGPMDEGPERIWGLEVRVTTAQTENTGLVGAFRPYAQVFQRAGITIAVSSEHASYFIQNRVAILAEERLALAIYRGSAFCKVTGI
jgi:HK97 family phage major capsid protein